MMDRPRVVGDYILTQKIGVGSFAVVWKAKHRLTGAEVAIKEIPNDKLNHKLSENLFSEIDILKKTNHPNIIRLYDTISTSNRIFLVLEFCAGGDLCGYIQRHKRVSEGVARHFMRQLGAGLQVLRANNLIHRDLKPQNLLLSATDVNATLKIADFGFARSLQPQGMAETLCGSPLYMAPEILQSKRYDAKADLWSVGTILYQLVTGQPPFVGQNPFQLLQNIQKTTELQFPKSVYSELHPECIDLCRKLLRKDPVERLSFEEFFNHSFLADPIRHEPFLSSSEKNLPLSGETKSFPDEPMPFLLDEEPPLYSGSPTTVATNTTLQVSPSNQLRGSGGDAKNSSKKKEFFIGERVWDSPFKNQASDANFKTSKSRSSEQVGILASRSKGAIMDSMEFLEKDYVLVSVPTDGMASLSASDQFTYIGHLSPGQKVSVGASPLPKSGSFGVLGSLKDPDTFRSSINAVDATAVHRVRRLHVLHRCAETIADLATNKYIAGHYLEAFSIQLVCLAVWKEALSFSSSRDDGHSHARGGENEITKLSLPFFDTPEDDGGIEAMRSHLVQNFFSAVEQAEGFAPHLRSLDGNSLIPDATEAIFQAALAMGKSAAVDELMGNLANAETAYTKAAILLYFLLTEAVTLPITPHFVLSQSDKQRLCNYIEMLSLRQSVCAVNKLSLQ